MAALKTAVKHPFASHKDYPHTQPLSLPDHFSMISAQKGAKHDETAHAALKQDLSAHGYSLTEVKGHYGHEEKSFMVPHKGTSADHKTIEQLGKKHGQEAVLHSAKGEHKLVFNDGRPAWHGKGHVHGPFLNKYHTQLPSGHKFTLMMNRPKEDVKKSDPKETYKDAVKANIETATKVTKPHYYGKVNGVHVFHATHESHEGMIGRHVHSPNDDDLQSALSDAVDNGSACVVVHGSPPPSLRAQALPAHHPHNYDWHDGHTDHHLDDDLKKDVGIPIPSHGNDQAAPKGVETYKPIAEKFGSIVPNKKSNLEFYRGLENSEPKIDELVAKHGFQTYFAGGKEYGKPDLKNKNYNTGHLMIYNPKPQSGGDFGNEEFTRSWRKLHELAHALTYKDVNNMYGEGRRLGKLGVRTPQEAKRAVHWEWLTAHKQRELAEGIGHKISDEDFHRELNTVMHDAVHRATTGQFAEPSDEGFHPHSHKIPLETSLGMIDQHAKGLGLMHPHATLAGPPKAMATDYPHINALKKDDTEEVKAGENMSDKKKNSITETAADAKEEERDLGSITQKLKELHSMVDRFKAKEVEEHKEMLATSELTKSIDDPETECSACERGVDDCVCYTGLSKPRMEFNGGKLSIFFKSEWQEEDRENFINDLKKRAGAILIKKKVEEAREVLGVIKKRINGRGSN